MGGLTDAALYRDLFATIALLGIGGGVGGWRWAIGHRLSGSAVALCSGLLLIWWLW